MSYILMRVSIPKSKYHTTSEATSRQSTASYSGNCEHPEPQGQDYGGSGRLIKAVTDAIMDSGCDEIKVGSFEPDQVIEEYLITDVWWTL